MFHRLKQFKKRFLLTSLGFVLAIFLSLSILGLQIWRYPVVLPGGETYDCGIVLGAAITNTEPSPVFQARLDHGIDLYNANVLPKLIFTGGVGEGDRFSESEVASMYAQANGIPEPSILLETTSKTTTQNLSNAKALMDRHNLTTAAIISDRLHLRRSVMIARWLGIDARASATPTTRYQSLKTKLPFLLREIYFTLHFKIFRK